MKARNPSTRVNLPRWSRRIVLLAWLVAFQLGMPVRAATPDDGTVASLRAAITDLTQAFGDRYPDG